jgi:hypothetical protein
MTEKTTLQNIRPEFGTFKPETDIGAWVNIDPEIKPIIEEKIEGIGKDGFETLNTALLLDIPVELLSDRSKWEERIQNYLEPIHASFNGEVGHGVGRVRTFSALVGNKESPNVVVFFDTRLDNPTGPDDTSYILMYTATGKFNWLDKPKEWGIKKKLQPYNGADWLPKISEFLKG